MHRYLAVIWDSCNTESVQASQSFKAALACRTGEWSVSYDGPGAVVAHAELPAKATQRYAMAGASGVVLGRLFNRIGSGREPRAVRFGDDETKRIVNSAGQHLVERYWGTYFAVLFDAKAGTHHVFRDPIGNVPCYHLKHRSTSIFFSHIEDCIRFFPVSLTVNREFLTRWLIYGGLRSRHCGLTGIEEIPGAERVTLSRGRVERASLWNPAAIAANARENDPETAARELRQTVQATIDAWASCYQVITHKLSGGLDSSIVAGCLAQAPSHPAINYLNFSVDVGFDRERLHLPNMKARTADRIRAIAAHGDERHLARLVAERWQAPLLERQRDTALDLSRMWHAPPSLNPSMYFTAMESDDAQLELVKSLGTQAFFSGQAGDSVLLATVQPFPAIDYARQHGIGPGLWPHLMATTRLSRESLWGVLGKALWHGSLRRPYRAPISILQLPSLVRTELTAALTGEDFTGPLPSLTHLPVGKQNHVAGVQWAAYYDFVFFSGRHADDVDPLNSQPVWELMLQLPTYTILADGVSRGLARRAFADLLPPEIRRRTAKGIGTPFYQQVVRNNRRRLQEWLLDGLLVREGYLDRDRLDRYLSADEPFVTVSAAQVLSYLAAEIWLQQWPSAASPLTRASVDTVPPSPDWDLRSPAARTGTSRDYGWR
jgi:asparagine synthase (glutamine-hydrolysing)